MTYEKKAEETLVIVFFPSEKVEGELTLHWRFYNNFTTTVDKKK